MQRSETIGALAAALAKAQGAIRGASKDRTNPHFKSDYATLSSVWDACREPLAANGLAVVQTPSADGKAVSLATHLLHASGEWIAESLTVPVSAPGGVQQVGSAITYARRYALAALVGVAPDDDDGEAAQGTHRPAPKPPPKRADPSVVQAALDQVERATAPMNASEVPETLVDTLARRIREATNVRPALVDIGAEVKLAAEQGAITAEERTFLGQCIQARKMQLVAPSTEQAA